MSADPTAAPPLAGPPLVGPSVRRALAATLPSLSWISPGVLGHGVRTAIAAILALYIAYAVQLESPQIALLTVLLVTNPMSGAVISKSVWRLVATVIGASMGLVLMAAFGQSPGAFMLLYSLWLGLCVVMATRLRRFRSYAAALSGYTLALTALGAIDNPLHTFDIAHARVGAITVGVLCKMLVSGVIWPVTAAERLDSRLRRVGGEVARFLLDTLALPTGTLPTGATLDAMPLAGDRRVRELLAEIQTLDDMASYATVESAAFQAQGQAARAAAAALYGLLSIAWPLRRALTVLPEAAAPVQQSLELIATGDLPVFRKAVADALRQVRAIAHAQRDPAHLAAANRLIDGLNHLVVVATAQDGSRAATLAVSAPDAPDGPPGAALITGVRTVLGCGMASAFWMLTQFPNGPTMMTWGSMVCALLASRPNPVAASMQTLRAALWAGVIGMVYAFLILPRFSDFLPLALSLVPLILGCAVIASRPGQADFGTFLPIFTLIMVAPTNPMVFDLKNFLNLGLSVVLGAGWSVLTFWLILPVNPRREAARLLAHVTADVRSLVTADPLPSMPGWEFRQYNRLARLATWQKEKGDDGELTLARQQLDIGRGLIILRHLLAPDVLPTDQRRQGDLIIGAVARLAQSPERLAAFLYRSARRLAAGAQAGRTEGERRTLMAMAAACQQIADAVSGDVDAPSPGAPNRGPDVANPIVANQDGVSGTGKKVSA